MRTENPYRAAGTFAGISYIEREADTQLVKEIHDNRLYPYFLAPRQSGKSSLINQTIQKLSQDYRCVFIDLSALSPECLANYDQFLQSISSELLSFTRLVSEIQLDSDLKRIIKEVAIRSDKRVIIFIDEIDHLFTSKFKDAFFALIRYFFNQRAHEPHLKKIQFVLAGTALPTHLISKENQSPFNVGKAITLDDLTKSQISAMLDPLLVRSDRSQDIVSKIFDYTKGSVYLTQLVLERIWTMCESKRIEIEVGHIDKVIEDIIIESPNNIHFFNIYSSVVAKPDKLKAFQIYAQGGAITTESLEYLKMVGISGPNQPYRNPIYGSIFGPNGPLSLLRDDSSPRLSLPFGGHHWYVVSASILYALLYTVALVLEIAYQFDQYRTSILRVSIGVFIWTFVTSIAGLGVVWRITMRPKGITVFYSLLIFIGAALLLYGALTLYLPDHPITEAGFQTYPARAAYLKDIFYLLPLAIVFLILPYHFVLSLQRELSAGKYRSSLALLLGEKSGVAPGGSIYLKPWPLCILLLTILMISVAINARLLDNLIPRPYMNLFVQLVQWRMILYFGLGLLCVLWYFKVLSDIKRTCLEVIAADAQLQRPIK